MTDIYIYPGQWTFCTEPSQVRTILGSCVAVCLFDIRRKVGGLNHYLLPDHPAGEEKNARYGSVAIPLLIKAFLNEGSLQTDLRAKVYGGGNVLKGVGAGLGQTVGDKNIEIARRLLAQHNIPIVEENVGGMCGRKIQMCTHDFEVSHTLMRDMRDQQLYHELKALSSTGAHSTPPSARVSGERKRSFSDNPNNKVLLIASSTGGTEALKVVLKAFNENIPPTLIVQHMPPVFTTTFAEMLDKMYPFKVKEAEAGDTPEPGTILLAPGDYHMELVMQFNQLVVHLHQQPLLHGVRPAADFLFKTAAKLLGPRCVGLVLTGMGRDGAQGLLEMKHAGSFNVAQDEASSVVYGMPKAAVEVGAIDTILPLDSIGPFLAKRLNCLKAA